MKIFLISLNRPGDEDGDIRLIACGNGANKGRDENYPEVITIPGRKRLKFAIRVDGVRHGTEIV